MSKGKIIFLHPDLGVGGAERLVVDAALALKDKGYQVKFVTAHHDEGHCFKETKDGSLEVTVVGEWIPRELLGRFFALFAYLKMIYCALYIIFFEQADCVFCDLVSVQIPLLHFSINKVVFYCHFPDQLLSKEEGILKKIYRTPLNWLEEKSTGCADKIYVNSAFTKSVYKNTFPSLKTDPDILYPSINTSFFDNFQKVESDWINDKISVGNFVFLSINRYERKKNIELSIKALKHLKELLSVEEYDKCALVIAGGYDNRVVENVEYFKELEDISHQVGLQDKIIFLKSPSDLHKVALLNRCDCLLYTPHNEHFGIVPLEAMYCKKPVIAVRSGGPTETIIDNSTGFLCDSNEVSFAESMKRLVKDSELKDKMGLAGHSRFLEKFSFQAFANQLDSDLRFLLEDTKCQ